MSNQYGKLLRALRRESTEKVTLARLAEFLGFTVAYISDVERGKRNPFDNETSIKIAEFLGADPEPLLTAASETRGYFKLPLNPGYTQEDLALGSGLAREWHKRASGQTSELTEKLLKDWEG